MFENFALAAERLSDCRGSHSDPRRSAQVFMHNEPRRATRTTCMARPATGPAAAPTSFKQSLSGSMLGSSIQRFRKLFLGSSSTRSGGTAARAASMFATAIGSMMPNDVPTWIVEYA
jgi:hypothetical protein